ncbi:hypothetical protein DID75_05335 [Candidatus Marinamargulisbacteria bacterium SCGC AG-410-N11]|nr:hypothetical protein DID75_05335 [Candidatus Marinamargulisbacteria bacterium SCGC AG-410-N11]
MNIELLVSILKIVIVVSISFVWIVRYSNIVKEFEEYNFPNWFRDSMGIIKLSACGMIVVGSHSLVLLATAILSLLMLAAFFTHIKYKHSLIQMIPSFSLMASSIFIALNTI